MHNHALARALTGIGAIIATTGIVLTLSTSAAYALTTDVAPVLTIKGPDTGLDGNLNGLVVGNSGSVYETDQNGDAEVLVFSPGASGDDAPHQDITGDQTGLVDPYGIAVDSTGNIYVADPGLFDGNGAVLVFAPHADNNVAPIRRIAVPGDPYDVAIAPTGKIWVTNSADDSIEVYAADADGPATPVQRIAGPSTGLNGVSGIAFDAAGNAYVADSGNQSVTSYAPDADGDAAPRTTLVGSHTDLGLDVDVAIAQDGSLLVIGPTATLDNALLTFPPNANGDVAPTQYLFGPASDFTDLQSIAVDSQGDQWVADDSDFSIKEFNIAVKPIDPSVGPTTGGQHVTISGHGFTKNVTSVTIGGLPLKDVVVVNSTTIAGITPPHAAGTVPVWVKFPGYTVRSAAPYTYVALAETGLDPSTSMVAGATMLVLGVGLFLGFRRRKPRLS